MGAGKSSVGRSLAVLSEREFMDTDLMLQNRLGRSVSQLFAIYGERAFRDHESSILRHLQPQPAVLSTGGGIVVRPENWGELRRLGITIYLDATPETLIARLEKSKKKRPLLLGEGWEDRLRELYAIRRPLYSQADLRITIEDEDVDGAANRVFEMIEEAGLGN